MSLRRLIFGGLLLSSACLASAQEQEQTPDMNELKFDLGNMEDDFGTFQGNLSDETRPSGGSHLTWLIGSTKTVSWTVTWNSTVDLLLCSRRQDNTWDNFTIESNFMGNTTQWPVSLDGLPPAASPPIDKDLYFFFLRETNGLPLIQSQNITIINNATTTTSSTSSATPPPTSPPAQASASQTGSPSAAAVANAQVDQGMHLSSGAIIGIAVGAAFAAALLLLACACLCCARRRKRDQQQQQQNPTAMAESGHSRGMGGGSGSGMGGALTAAGIGAGIGAMAGKVKSASRSNSVTRASSPADSLGADSPPAWFSQAAASSAASSSSKGTQSTLTSQSQETLTSPLAEFPSPPASATTTAPSTAMHHDEVDDDISSLPPLSPSAHSPISPLTARLPIIAAAPTLPSVPPPAYAPGPVPAPAPAPAVPAVPSIPSAAPALHFGVALSADRTPSQEFATEAMREIDRIQSPDGALAQSPSQPQRTAREPPPAWPLLPDTPATIGSVSLKSAGTVETGTATVMDYRSASRGPATAH